MVKTSHTRHIASLIHSALDLDALSRVIASCRIRFDVGNNDTTEYELIVPQKTCPIKFLVSKYGAGACIGKRLYWEIETVKDAEELSEALRSMIDRDTIEEWDSSTGRLVASLRFADTNERFFRYSTFCSDDLSCGQQNYQRYEGI